MQRKYVSYVACIIGNEIFSIDFFESLDDAYKELDRQTSDELDLLLKEGIPIDDITITNDSDQVTITTSKPTPLAVRFEAGFGYLHENHMNI